MSDTRDWNAEWHARAGANHALQVERGLHDPQCEWRPNGHFLCHCSKRKRERDGKTTPPGALIFGHPTCPGCREEVDHDGDSYRCDNCKVTWSSDGETSSFYDDYGDIDPAPWDERARLAAEGGSPCLSTL